ncbi:MAG: hypothetical protein COA63_001185 [Methylophaga sp.]|nr:hypothetical protein [Methylophaga sp.]
MNQSKAIIAGALVFAVTASIRPVLMGLDLLLVLTQFFIQNFALFAAVALVVSAAGLEKYKFFVVTVVAVPITSVVAPISINLYDLGFVEYLKSWDMNAMRGIALFAFLGALVGSWVVLAILSRNAKA